MNNKRFCTLELSQQLKEKGFDLPCEYIYANHYRVKDEILAQYPSLSDDGYKDLTIEGGGSLREDEVYATYTEPIREYSRNSWVDLLDYKVCTMPTLDDVRTWIRDNFNIHVVIKPETLSFDACVILPNQFGVVGVGSSSIAVYNPEFHPSHENARKFKTYEDALQTCIREALIYVPNPEKK